MNVTITTPADMVSVIVELAPPTVNTVLHVQLPVYTRFVEPLGHPTCPLVHGIFTCQDIGHCACKQKLHAEHGPGVVVVVVVVVVAPEPDPGVQAAWQEASVV